MSFSNMPALTPIAAVRGAGALHFRGSAAVGVDMS